MMNVQGRKKHMTSAQIIIFGFMVVIFYGSTAPHASHINQRTRGAPF